MDSYTQYIDIGYPRNYTGDSQEINSLAGGLRIGQYIGYNKYQYIDRIKHIKTKTDCYNRNDFFGINNCG